MILSFQAILIAKCALNALYAFWMMVVGRTVFCMEMTKAHASFIVVEKSERG